MKLNRTTRKSTNEVVIKTTLDWKKLQLSMFLTKHHAMETYGGVDV
jgi:hypothetical protein